MGSQDRCSLVCEKLSGVADAFVAVSPANARYLTGFSKVFDDDPASLVILMPGAQWVVTDSRYAEAARCAARGTPWQVEVAASGLADAASRILEESAVSRVAIETTLEHRRWRRFEEVLSAEVVEADGWVEGVRAVKEPDEIGRITAAQQLTDAAFEHILGVLQPGVTEAEIALELEVFMRRNGSEGVAFSPIVASGPNSALPHASVTGRALADGEFVVLDFGARVEGYCADMTRTVVIGHATPRHREIYEAVWAANLAGLAAVRAGVSGREVDAAARSVLETAGLSEYFGHGLGHGVGLEVHEAPGLSPRSDAVLSANAVITIEPGVYIPGFGGARIEDLVVVEEAGARLLTRSAKELIEL